MINILLLIVVVIPYGHTVSTYITRKWVIRRWKNYYLESNTGARNRRTQYQTA